MGVKLLGKIKIYELAKELNLTSKEVIEKANKIGIEAKTHMSTVDEEQAKKLKEQFVKKPAEKTAKKEEKKAPVIIRREVIITEEEKKENKNSNENHNHKQVGFVERNKNADYNIVYRNKPTKPMTVSELFGIGKKEETKKEEPKKVEQKKAETVGTAVTKETIKAENKPKTAETKKIENVEHKNNNIEQKGKNNSGEYQNRNNNRENFQNRNNHFSNRNDRGNFGQRNEKGSFQNRGDRPNFQNRNGNRDNNFQNKNKGEFRNNQNRGNFNNRERRPLDDRGIDRNIKDIMESDIIEKENQRDFSSRAIDKAKNARMEERVAGNNKKQNKNKKGGRFGTEEFDGGKLKGLKQVDRLSNMFNDQEGGMLDYYDLTTARGKRNKKKANKNVEDRKQKIFQLTQIEIPETITVKDLALELKKTSAEVIKKLFGLGMMVTINNDIDFDTAYLVAEEFGVTATKKQEVKEEDILFDDSEDRADELKERPPVVVVMGHVDHGKTSLLDAIRETNVIEGEAGGITQAIGAYKVEVNGREITFLDTPGHEAFTSMRARGAQITDIAILVVAANDGVMPQTIEAINHAKAAEIPIVVALNKIDVEGANPEKVKQELMKYELVPEEWGGDTIFVEISAKKRLNIDTLLEMVLLVADVKELKANPNKQSKGTVIEAKLDKTRGPVVSMLVQRGTLDVGDTIVVGSVIGRIRAMVNDKGKKVKKAGPSTPVEVIGLTEVPEAGEIFYEVEDEKTAKHLIEKRKRQEREKSINAMSKVSLNDLFSQIEKNKLKQLNLIVKADVQGSVEAVKTSLEKISNDEVTVKVIHSNVGGVTESDVTLAKVANAIIIAFNVRPEALAKEIAKKEEIEIKQYSVIYKAIEDVEAAMKGMLDPTFEEKVIGNAEIRQTFKVSNLGTIAGCYVLDGKITRNAGVRVIRDNVVIHEGKLASLKRFKDDVKEVASGYECGLSVENFNDLEEGDTLEVFVMEEIKK